MASRSRAVADGGRSRDAPLRQVNGDGEGDRQETPAIVGRRRSGDVLMPEENPKYDLVLLLSTSVEDEERAKIVADVESAIAAGDGTVERRDDWGVRPMSFRIQHQAEADYHLLQFSGPPALLESLEHSLRIADSVLRFRIIKVLPGQPPAPDSPPPVIAVAAHGSGGPPSRDTEAEPEG